MKLAVVSDIHGNLAALEAVLDDIARERVDATLNLGDILSGPLQPAETADRLMALGLPTIAGNHERQLLALLDKPGLVIRPTSSDGCAALALQPHHVAWLRGLPPTRVFEREVLMVHGTPHTDLHYWLETITPDFGAHGSRGLRAATPDEIVERMGERPPPAIALALCGHSHVPRVMALGDLLIVNPGSVGHPAYFAAQPHRHASESGSPLARYATVERRLGGWSASLKAVAYDHAPQARLAAERGFQDWARALATGTVVTPGMSNG